MQSRALCAVLLGAALGLSACGGKAPEPKPTPSVMQPAPPPAKPGTPAPEALVNAHCAPDPDGTWSAAGVLKNATKRTRSYEVVVQVGQANGQPSTAHVVRVSKVAPGKTAPFTATAIEAAAPAGTTPAGPCHIQVIAR